MKSIKRRLQALESKWTPSSNSIDVIIRSIVRPSVDGPVSLEAHSVSILSGPNAGLRLVRADDESEAAFIGQVSRLTPHELTETPSREAQS